jgi:uncharacterized protein
LAECVTEESFFRGLVQGKLTNALGNSTSWRWVPIVTSSVFFGLVHWGAGLSYIFCAMLSSFVSACAYAKFQRIEICILMHFALNASHFLMFTYPYLSR